MATVTKAPRTALATMAALAGAIAIGFAAGPATAQQQGEPAELRAGSGELAPLPGQGARGEREREGERGDARLFHPSIGFDVPTRAELLGRASETLRVSRQLVRESERELIRARREYQDHLESLPEVRDARRAVREASAELERARQDVERQLQEDEHYHETLARLEIVDDLIQEAHRRYDVSREQLLELAEQRLFYSERLDEIRRERGDLSAVEEARRRLSEAVRQQERVEAALRERLREAPEIAEAREQLDAAKRQYQSARIDYAGARAGYIEADRQQVTQTRVRRLQPVVHDPVWRFRVRGSHGGFIIVR